MYLPKKLPKPKKLGNKIECVCSAYRWVVVSVRRVNGKLQFEARGTP